jgi:hypothetical protein
MFIHIFSFSSPYIGTLVRRNNNKKRRDTDVNLQWKWETQTSFILEKKWQSFTFTSDSTTRQIKVPLVNYALRTSTKNLVVKQYTFYRFIAQPSDTGNYTCTGTNIAGSDTISTSVAVEGNIINIV